MAGLATRVKAVVERHHPGLPRLVTIPRATVAKWGLQQTTFPNLCRKAGVEVGDRVDVELRVAKEKLAGGEARLGKPNAS